MTKKTIWTKDMIDYLKKEYPNPKNKLADIALHLNIDKSLVRTKVTSLKLKRNPAWSEEALEYLINNYADTSSTKIAKHLDKTVAAVKAKAKVLNLQSNMFWSKDEVKVLETCIESNTDFEKTCELIPNRTPIAIEAKARSLGHSFYDVTWKEEEIEFLKKYYPNPRYSVEDIANSLNRTKIATLAKACKLGITREIYKTIDGVDYRYCTGCEEYLILDNFIKRNDIKHDKAAQPKCRACINKQNREKKVQEKLKKIIKN